MDSHYCRAKTNKKYIEPGLDIEKMYDLYKCNVPTTGVLLLSLHFIAMFLITFSTLVFTVQNQIGVITVRSIKSKSKKEYLFLKKKSETMIFICMKKSK